MKQKTKNEWLLYWGSMIDTAHAYETTQIKIEPTNQIIQQPWYKRLIQSLLFRKQITNI